MPRLLPDHQNSAITLKRLIHASEWKAVPAALSDQDDEVNIANELTLASSCTLLMRHVQLKVPHALLFCSPASGCGRRCFAITLDALPPAFGSEKAVCKVFPPAAVSKRLMNIAAVFDPELFCSGSRKF